MKRFALFTIAACGGSGGTPDATPTDALESTGSVTVIVSERGKPVSGLPVYFRGLDGTTFQAVTSLEGASGFDLVDGFVTVHLPRARYGADRLFTYAGVKTQDKLLLELDPPSAVQLVELDVTVAADAGQPGPFQIYTTCEHDEPTAMLAGTATVGIACREPRVDLLAVRFDPQTHAPLTAQRKSIDTTTTRAVTFDGPYDPVAAVDVQYTNVGAFTYASTFQAIVTANGRLFASTDGAAPNSPQDPVTVRQPLVPNTTLLVATTAYPPAGALDEQVLYQWRATPPVAPASTSIDLGDRLPAYTSAGAFDAASRTLAWTEATGTQTSELVRARVQLHREDIPIGTNWTWDIVAPRTGTTVAFPELPVDLEPRSTDTAAVLELTNISLPAGTTYDGVRPRGFGDVNRLISPSDGTMVVQRQYVREPE